MVAEQREFRFHAPEILIFSACRGRIQALLSLVRSFETGSISKAIFVIRINAVLRQLIRTVEATHRFDLVAPVTDFGQFSASFWRWFNWWNDYRKTLSSDQIDEIELLAQRGLSAIDNYRPVGDWMTYPDQTPAFMLEIC